MLRGGLGIWKCRTGKPARGDFGEGVCDVTGLEVALREPP